MNFEMENTVIPVLENTMLSDAECPIDGEYVLPEYCPDIAAVLKCSISPAVLSRQWSGDSVLVDGQSLVRVLYLDEERKCVRVFECVVPFSCSVAAGGISADTLPQVAVRVGYINCRASGPRRIGIHGALKLTVQAELCKEQTVIGNIQGERIYSRTSSFECTAPIGTAEKNFTISETVDLGGGKPPAETLLRHTVTPIVSACKQMTDKVIVKGRVILHTLYIADSESGVTVCTEHEFPFSQIIDFQGMDDTVQCTAMVEAWCHDMHITPDQNGDNTLLSVNIKLCAAVTAYQTQTCQVVSDAYSAVNPCNTDASTLHPRKLLCVREDTHTLKEVLELPSESIHDIVDLWCEPMQSTVRLQNSMTYVDGRLQICMLARDRDGGIAYYEHVTEYCLQNDIACDVATANVNLTDIQYGIVGGKIEIRLEISLALCCYTQHTCSALTQISLGEETYPEERAALRIRRAKKGDSVWEIAKGCHTAVQAVLDENELDGDIVPQDMMILVPLC